MSNTRFVFYSTPINDPDDNSESGQFWRSLREACKPFADTHIETITLDDEDRDIFLDLLDNPPDPNDALIRAVKEFRRMNNL